MIKRITIVAVMISAVMTVPTVAQASDTPQSCRVVKVLERAGFTGNANRIAYAIVMRESRGANLNESSRWFTGALGIWQVQTSVWSGKPWWSRGKMLTPRKQSRIVFKHLTDRGTSWAHWGISRDGRGMDTTYYSGWSSWQQWNWIWEPYDRFYRAYPRCGS